MPLFLVTCDIIHQPLTPSLGRGETISPTPSLGRGDVMTAHKCPISSFYACRAAHRHGRADLLYKPAEVQGRSLLLAVTRYIDTCRCLLFLSARGAWRSNSLPLRILRRHGSVHGAPLPCRCRCGPGHPLESGMPLRAQRDGYRVRLCDAFHLRAASEDLHTRQPAPSPLPAHMTPGDRASLSLRRVRRSSVRMVAWRSSAHAPSRQCSS